MVDFDAICRDAEMELLGGVFHRCQCRSCASDLFPPIPPEGSPYIAAENGPKWAQTYKGRPSSLYIVVLNGRDTREPYMPITEAYEGDYGWVIYQYQDVHAKVHACHCGSPYRCLLVMHGTIEFIYAPSK